MKILVKEAAEEASIPEELCSVAKFVGTLEFSRHAGGSLQPEKEFIFDIELPADFQGGKRFFRYWTRMGTVSKGSLRKIEHEISDFEELFQTCTLVQKS